MKMFFSRHFDWMVVGGALCVFASGNAENLMLLDDPGELHFKVAGIECVREIIDEAGHSSSNVGEGGQIAIVTLEGMAKKPCRVQFHSSEFSAAFEYEAGTGPGGSLIKEERVHRSLGIAIDDGGWTTSRDPLGGDTLVMARFPKSGKVTLRVAFIMPASVTDFTVRCPQAIGRTKITKRLKTSSPPAAAPAPKSAPSKPNKEDPKTRV